MKLSRNSSTQFGVVFVDKLHCGDDDDDDPGSVFKISFQ